MKLIFISLLFGAQCLCFVAGDHPRLSETEKWNCATQYLKDKGLLDDNITVALPQSTEACEYQMRIHRYFIDVLQLPYNEMRYEIEKEMTIELNCLMYGINDTAVDEFLKLVVIRERGTEYNLQNQFAATIDKLNPKLEKISLQCQLLRSLVLLLQPLFSVLSHSINNSSVALQQRQYCLTQYVADNRLYNFNGADLNSNNVDSSSVNCTTIIDIERQDDMQKTRDSMYKLGAQSAEEIECAMNVYENKKMFDWTSTWNVCRIPPYRHDYDPSKSGKVFLKIAEISKLMSECKIKNV